MIWFPHLGTLASSATHLLLVAGFVILVPMFVDPQRSLHRVFLFGVSALLGLRYIWWRGTETLAPAGFTPNFLASATLFTIEALAMIGGLSAYVLLTRSKSRSAEATANAGWWDADAPPRIAVLIATYNEGLEVLERTIVGAASLRYENKEVVVLDDGRRDWLRDYCAERGVSYLRRPDNKGSKAGNINHGLGVLNDGPNPPDFIAVLDADFIPHRGFLSRSLALFRDPAVGLVQTPQHFFNADPIQHNLGVSRSYPDEQRFFFDHMQSSRDGWDIAICCGTSSMARMKAIREIGGLPTSSITEDFLLTLTLQGKGWHTAYLNEPLTEGLAPEGLKEYVTQRARWCLGLMQIARGEMGPFRDNGLRLRDRWSVIDSVFYWLVSFIFRIAGLLFPLLYWYGNVIVVDAALPDVISYFGCYYLWAIMAMNVVSRGIMVPILHDVSALIGALPIARAAITGLIRPKGHAFSVTAKGGDRSKVVVQWRLMAPFATVFALTLGGLLIGITFDSFSFNDAGDGKWVILFWTIYNLVVLSVTMAACVELPRTERHVADKPERAIFVADGTPRRVWITSLTQDTVRVRGQTYSIGDRGAMRIADVGDVEASVIATTQDGARLQLRPTPAQRDALFLRFYAEDNTPGITAVKLVSVIGDLLRHVAGRRRGTRGAD